MIFLLLAVVTGLLVAQQPALAVVLAALPVVLLLAIRPVVLTVVAVALLALPLNVLPGLGVEVSPSDLLLLAAAAVLLLTRLLQHEEGANRGISALRPFLIIYTAILLVVLAEHPTTSAVINSGQRLQLVLVPVAIGAQIMHGRARALGLTLFVIAAVLVGLAFNANIGSIASNLQKNPVGQYAADGILVVLAAPLVGGAWRYLLLAPLSIVLLDTGSRGALVGLVVGVMVLLAARPGVNRLRLLAILIPGALALGIAFATLPSDDRQRLTTFSSSDTTGFGTSGQSTIKIRDGYRQEGLRSARAHLLTGLGIGNYIQATSSLNRTSDPHNVLLLEVVEGGLPLLVGYVVLITGTSIILVRRRHLTPLAPLALAMQAAIVAHGMFDVYWVRGTPELGWLLVGAALAEAQRVRPSNVAERQFIGV